MEEERRKKKEKENTSFGGGVSLGNVAGHGGEEGDAVLGSSNGVGRGRVHDEAAKLSGGLQIHVVNAHTGSSHHLQPPFPSFKHFPRHLGGAPHNQSVAARDLAAELLLREVVRAFHVPHTAQHLEPRLSKFLGDQDRWPIAQRPDILGLRAPHRGFCRVSRFQNIVDRQAALGEVDMGELSVDG